MNVIRCSDCGTLLPEYKPPARSCPICGSKSRTVSVTISEAVSVSDYFQGIGSHANEIIAFAESHRPRYTRHASLQEDGTIRLSLKGLPPRNEEDSDEVIKHLVAHLALQGEQLTNCGRGAGDDDFLLAVDCKKRPRVSVQVVRALCTCESHRY